MHIRNDTGSRQMNVLGLGRPPPPHDSGSRPQLRVAATYHAYQIPKLRIQYWNSCPAPLIDRLTHSYFSALGQSVNAFLNQLEFELLNGQVPDQLIPALEKFADRLAELILPFYTDHKLDDALKQEMVQRVLELVDDMRDRMPPSIDPEPESKAAESKATVQELDMLKFALDQVMKPVITLSLVLQRSMHAPRPLLRPVSGPSPHASAAAPGRLPPHGIETNRHPPSMGHGFLECRYTGKLGNSA